MTDTTAPARPHPACAPGRGGAYRAAWWLSVGLIPLGAVASVAGLLAAGELYGDSGIAPVIQGQDLVTLLALPVLAASLVASRRGSTRGTIVWTGVAGYLLYTYIGAALTYEFNRLFPVYVALLSCSAFALGLLVSALDVEAMRARFDGDEPRRTVAVFLGLVAVTLGIGELGQVIGAVASGEEPVIAGTDAPLNFVFALDLGFIVPLSALGAWLLWRRAPWGYPLAGFLLIKAATMGLALVSMVWFAARTDLPGDPLAPLWVAIALGGLALSTWFLRHCRD